LQAAPWNVASGVVPSHHALDGMGMMPPSDALYVVYDCDKLTKVLSNPLGNALFLSLTQYDSFVPTNQNKTFDFPLFHLDTSPVLLSFFFEETIKNTHQNNWLPHFRNHVECCISFAS